jgi:hypothetical protein
LKKGTKRSNNVSKLVRDHYTANPGISQSQVVKDLLAQGHKVYPALVSQAIRNLGGKKPGPKPGSKKRGRPAKAAAVAVSTTLDFSAIEAAAKFVMEAGSIENAVAAFSSYQKIAKLLA